MNRSSVGSLLGFCLAALFNFQSTSHAQSALPHPILFVTQVPQPADFTTIGSTFGNHRGTVESAPRGGDLWIRYPDGTMKNLTKAAGFGLEGAQHTSGIAVREPSVHWNGTKAVFSMVIGAPSQRYQVKSFYWQLYEVTNFLDPNAIPVITKVSNQPTNYNNVAPCYGTDDRVIFASDRPRDGQRHLYPQLDEYEEAPTVTGLWSLDPATGDLFIINHSPSGVFSPSIDSFGRVIFSRWDHLQRDQQADADGVGGNAYGTFNYTSEATNAVILTNNRTEVFPEPRYASGTTNGHRFNHFFPWQINEDGTEEETLNHLGRQELGGSYASRSFNNDPNLVELYYFGNKFNTNTILNFFHPRESPLQPGFFYGTDAPEFGTHSGGQIVMIEAHISTNADFNRVRYVTHRATATVSANPTTNHSGLYRNPLPLSDGRLAAIHTAETRADQNIGTSTSRQSRYDFRLKLLKLTNGYHVADIPLTPGLSNSVTWWTPDELYSYDGLLWELDPVEVRPRPKPTRRVPHLAAPEASVFAEEGVDVSAFQRYLRERDLALIVGLNATTRDKGDKQQPFNLRVPGGAESIGTAGKVYNISHLQLYQADMIRGIGMNGGQGTPRAGRRALAQEMHDPAVDNPPNPSGPQSSVKLALDGSFASFVPGGRAMSWQTTDDAGTPVVRERYWITFRSGEIRTCTSCHGANRHDQAAREPSTNAPLALRELLRYWKQQNSYAQILKAARTNSEVVFAISGAPHRTNILEATSDLGQWLPINTNSTTTNGLFFMHDPAASEFDQRFYRMKVQ